MGSVRGIWRADPFGRAWATLSVLLLSSAARLDSLSWAQTACGGVARTTPIRVENATGVGVLRAVLNCTTSGSGENVEASWVGRVPVDAPIVVAEGTFLSVTGEAAAAAGALAEVHGGNQTRLFEVFPGGGLTLTGLKLSGGSAGEGGAVYSHYANLTFDRCNFDGNLAMDGSGGAVWARGGNVTVVGGEFFRNTATRVGGAVYAVDGRLKLQGGARFEVNQASAGGGALFCGLGELGPGPEAPVPVCSITDAEFVSNSAYEHDDDDDDDEAQYSSADVSIQSGGAAMFMYAVVDITDSVFSGNYATHSGGAVDGSYGETSIVVTGCTFGNNTSGGLGGAIIASFLTLGGGTQLTNNSASEGGGAVLGLDTGTITFNDVSCTGNSGGLGGGCFMGMAKSVINDGTVMHDNVAMYGGCINAYEGSDISVNGGDFTCRCTLNGAFLFAGDGTRVNITGGLIESNVADRRGGAVYCSGDSSDLGGSRLTIEGGTFRNNSALELGGVIVAWGAPTVVTITGGVFSNNTAKFYGGFVFLEEEASMECEGATITGNFAGEQGGGIYAREAGWVHSSCDLIANESPQGAAIYLTNVKSATFENHTVADNVASGGSVVYVTESYVGASGVTFESGVGLQEDSYNRAVQLDGDTTLTAEGCVFRGWRGDTVIYHQGSVPGSLVLDSCDFSESSAAMAVISPNSDVEIRNAVVSSRTFLNAGTLSNSLRLVDRALDCSDSNACGGGECVNSTLGVLCECLENGGCLDDGGELSLRLETPPAVETFDPDTVSYKLMVSAASDGTTFAIWNLAFEADDLALDVVPSSGVLPPGSNVSITVTGTPMTQDVGGNLSSKFILASIGGARPDVDGNVKLEVDSTFYLCQAHEYAMPLANKDDGGVVVCEQCVAIEGEQGVNCERMGATLTSLPIRQGYWRSSQESLVVHRCFNSAACQGATKISSSDDYCKHGYKGPYCAVCIKGYGRSLSNCHSCDGTTAQLLVVACALFSLAMITLFLLAFAFLVGGPDAVNFLRQSMLRKLTRVIKTFRYWHAVRERTMREKNDANKGAKLDPMGGTTPPGFNSASYGKHDDGEGDTGYGPGSTTLQRFDNNGPEITCIQPLGGSVEAVAGVERSSVTGNRHASSTCDEARPVSRQTHRQSAVPSVVGVTGAAVDGGELGADASGGGVKFRCGVLGKKIKRWTLRFPMEKVKILVVVWQILAVFSGVTGVEFPKSYSLFLAWINILNFDLGYVLSASCVLPSVNFYDRLVATTLVPFVLVAALVFTYRAANRRAGIGSAGVVARTAAWSRHVAAGLLVTFLVFTSASSVVFNTFPCDDGVVDGESYLRADYSISCNTRLHAFFRAYAGVMILVYPIGIPVLYSVILWKYRELLNPRIYAGVKCEPDDGNEESTRASSPTGDGGTQSSTLLVPSNVQHTKYLSLLELQQLEERVEARKEHPELVPFMFLWKDFDPNMYYYEVIECGRRILLTDLLIVIAPHSAIQAAVSCIFAFVALLGFELLRPHLDPADSWLYRLGGVLIFLNSFLAVLIKADIAGEASRSAFGGGLVAVNLLLVLAVLGTVWLAMRDVVGDSNDEDNTTPA